MANELNEIVTCIRMAGRITIRIACNHPFVLGTVFFLYVLYRFFPSLFALFVSSSPVLICTTVLLGILLSYGEPNVPAMEENKKALEVSSMKDENLTTAKEAAVVGKGRDINASPSSKESKKDMQGEKKLTQNGGLVEKIEQIEGAKKAGGDSSSKDQKKSKGLKVETDKSALDNNLNSSLGSPWEPVDACSDTTSDRSSSPDASITDVIPVLDELHPLLDVNAPQPAFKSVDDSDAEDQESDDGSALEEEEEEDNQDEEEDAHEGKDDTDEKVVSWTEDDQKNLMDLGTSEMERNQRLENLIAKRSMRRSLIPEIVSNLIDLDSNDPMPTAEELSRFHVQIPPRRNPFDAPFDTDEAMGLPPIPGSAPSILLPTRNPFDLPFDQVDQGSGLVIGPVSHSVFVPVPQRDPFFRRHESFSVGTSFPGEFRQDKQDGGMKPYFIPERVEETGFPTFQRQLSDKSDSKLSSIPESEISSSAADESNHKELLEEGLHQESELLSRVSHDAEPVEQGSQSSEDEQSESNIGDAHVMIGLNNSTATGVTHHASDAGYDSSISNAAKREVIEDKYDDSSSSSDEKISNLGIHEGPINLDPARGDSSKASIDSVQLPSKVGERVDDGQVADPVYDSSPSAAEKSLAEDLFRAGSPPRPHGKNISSGSGFGATHEDSEFSSGGLWVASPSLSSVDEIESRSREISEIKERDVIQVALPGVREDFVKPIALVMPRTISGRIIHPSGLSSVEAESSEDSS